MTTTNLQSPEVARHLSSPMEMEYNWTATVAKAPLFFSHCHAWRTSCFSGTC